jgi:hypothetical protein
MPPQAYPRKGGLPCVVKTESLACCSAQIERTNEWSGNFALNSGGATKHEITKLGVRSSNLFGAPLKSKTYKKTPFEKAKLKTVSLEQRQE